MHTSSKLKPHRKLWRLFGQLFFWITLPALLVYLRLGKRTRVLVRVGDEFLVVQGWYGDGRWQIPGGGLHRGEDSKQGALRELHEETGLSLGPTDLGLVAADLRSPGILRFTFDFYIVRLPAKPEITLQVGELHDYAWLTLPATPERLTKDSAQALALLNLIQ